MRPHSLSQAIGRGSSPGMAFWSLQPLEFSENLYVYKYLCISPRIFHKNFMMFSEESTTRQKA